MKDRSCWEAQVTKPSSKSSAYARFIPREEVGDVMQWRFSAVGADAASEEQSEVPELPPAVDEAAQAAAEQHIRDEAFALGHAQGVEQAALEWQHRLDDYVAGQGVIAAQQLASLAAAFEQGLAAAQQNVAQGVLELACEIARHVVRRELQSDRAALQPVIAEALGSLVADGRPIAVRLHPIDAQALGSALKTEFSAAAIQWIADASVAPGGCLVEQAGAVIDGQLERRWQRALAPLGIDMPWREEADHAAD